MHHPNTFQIDAMASEFWAGWPAATTTPRGLHVRSVFPGQESTISFAQVPSGDLLLVVTLGQPPRYAASSVLRLTANGQPLEILNKKQFPELLVCEIRRGADTPLPLVATFRGAEWKGTEPLVEIASLAVLSKNAARFSPVWTSLVRGARSLLTGGKSLPWTIEDFPYSHFDGLGYLLAHHEARTAVLSRTFSTAYQYFQRKGKQLGHELLLATYHPPLPGTAFNLVSYYRAEHQTLSGALAQLKADNELQRTTLSRELNDAKEENELLLFQLHEAQLELERLFGENQELMRRVESAQQYKA